MKKVLVAGTFDILHEGHLDFFRQARENGDFLIVIVGRDATVEKVKGRKPLHDENKRLKKVSKCPLVDKAVLGYLGDKHWVIKDEKPDVICLGYDQVAFTENLQERLEENGIEAEVIRLQPYKQDEFKSSILKKSLKGKGDN